MAFLKEQLGGMRDLAKEGYVARNRLLDLERTYAQLSGAISEDIGNIGTCPPPGVRDGHLRRTQRQQDYQKEVRSQLSDVHKEAESLGRAHGQKFEVASVDVKAPVAGTVVGWQRVHQGRRGGARLQDDGDRAVRRPLVVEGQLAVNLVDRVHTGLKTELIFSAFNANKTPHIPGESSRSRPTVAWTNAPASLTTRCAPG
jgi:protease secretion system membrane fusion protein